MTTQDDVRLICSKLPGAIEGESRFGFSVEVKGKHKGFCWSWAERIHPKRARVINDGVLAVSVPDLTVKDIILGSDSAKFFTEPHYDGFPAVLVRLAEVEPGDLEPLLIEAWRTKAPRDLLERFDATGSP